MLVGATDNTNRPLPPTTGGPTSVGAQTAATTATNNNVRLSAFISEDTVASITKLVAEKFQGQKGIIGFGNEHLGIPSGAGLIVPSEKYLAENLEAIVKANNIKVITFEKSSSDHINTNNIKIARLQQDTIKDFKIEANTLLKAEGIDESISKLIIKRVIDKHINPNSQSIGLKLPSLFYKLSNYFVKAILFCLKLPGLRRIENMVFDKDDGLQLEFAGNMIFKQAKKLGLTIQPTDAPIRHRLIETLHQALYEELLKLYLTGLKSLAPELKQEFENATRRLTPYELKQITQVSADNKYLELLTNITRRNPRAGQQQLVASTKLMDSLNTKIEKMGRDRENMIADSLRKVLTTTDGNVMAVYGACHVVKATPETTKVSAFEKISQDRIPTANIYCTARDIDANSIQEQIPASSQPQYLRTNSPHLKNPKVMTLGDKVPLSQAYDALIVLPKLKAA